MIRGNGDFGIVVAENAHSISAHSAPCSKMTFRSCRGNHYCGSQLVRWWPSYADARSGIGGFHKQRITRGVPLCNDAGVSAQREESSHVNFATQSCLNKEIF
jgi:hypothetical protein